MASVEEYIASLSEEQQQIVAMAGLSGAKWELGETKDWNFVTRRYQSRTIVEYSLPGDDNVRFADDILEAALSVLRLMGRETTNHEPEEVDMGMLNSNYSPPEQL